MSGPIRPTFIQVGAMKAGTSTMHNYLNRHPQVFVNMTPDKELHYFDKIPKIQKATRDEYIAKFQEAGDAAAIGESTPAYSFIPGAIPSIAKFDPEMRIIYMVRDPVSRAISQIAHRGRLSRWPIHRHLEVGSVWDELVDDLRTQDQFIGRPWKSNRRGYHVRGLYHEQLRRIYKHFPEEQVVVVRLEDFIADRQTELDRVTDTLGIDRYEFGDLGRVNEWGYDKPKEEVYEYLTEYYALPNLILHEEFGIRIDDWRAPGHAIDRTGPVLGKHMPRPAKA